MKLNKVAEDAIQKFSVAAEPQRVDVRSFLIDPLNRHGTPMSGKRVHRLLRDILKAGFTLKKAQVGVVVDIPPTSGRSGGTQQENIAGGFVVATSGGRRDALLLGIAHEPLNYDMSVLSLPSENDRGGWRVGRDRCRRAFVVDSLA